MENIIQTYFNILYHKYNKLCITAPVGLGLNYKLLKIITNDIKNNNKNLLIVSYNKIISNQIKNDLFLYLKLKKGGNNYYYNNSNLIEFKTITDIMKNRYSKKHNDILYIDDSLNNNYKLSDILFNLIKGFDKVIIKNSVDISKTKFSKIKNLYYENIKFHDNTFLDKLKQLERRLKIDRITNELL